MRLMIPLAVTALAAAGVFATEANETPVELEPGLWQVETHVEKFVATGLPDGQESHAKAVLLGDYLAATPEQCITPEEAKEALTPSGLSRIGAGGEDCKVSTWDVTGGNVNVEGSCRSVGGDSERRFTAGGTIGRTKLDLVIAFDVKAPSLGAEIESELRVTGRRLGACKAAPSPDAFGSRPSRAAIEAAAEAMHETADAETVFDVDAAGDFEEAANAAASMLEDHGS